MPEKPSPCPVDGLYHGHGAKRLTIEMCSCDEEIVVHGGPVGFYVIIACNSAGAE